MRVFSFVQDPHPNPSFFPVAEGMPQRPSERRPQGERAIPFPPERGSRSMSSLDSQPTSLPSQPAAGTPRWHRSSRTLYVGEQPVKTFKRYAPNLFDFLAAFEAASWAERIGNPLAGKGPRALRDAVTGLNKAQQAILFRCDGNDAVNWRPNPGDPSPGTNEKA